MTLARLSEERIAEIEVALEQLEETAATLIINTMKKWNRYASLPDLNNVNTAIPKANQARVQLLGHIAWLERETEAQCMVVLDLCEKIIEKDALIAALWVRIEQHRGALGYSVSGDIAEDPEIHNGIAEALHQQIAALELRVALERAAYDKASQWIASNVKPA
jgi:hypothetical protein